VFHALLWDDITESCETFGDGEANNGELAASSECQWRKYRKEMLMKRRRQVECCEREDGEIVEQILSSRIIDEQSIRLGSIACDKLSGSTLCMVERGGNLPEANTSNNASVMQDQSFGTLSIRDELNLADNSFKASSAPLNTNFAVL